MHQLKALIEQSRHWGTADRGSTLFSQAAGVIHSTLGIQTGMFVYRPQFIAAEAKSRVYHPWGLHHSASELTDYLHNGTWFWGEPGSFPERWLHVSECTSTWQRVWTEANVAFVRPWPLTVRGTMVGAIVLGFQGSPDEDLSDLMSVCATYISLVGEMLLLRRIAEDASRRDPLTGILNRRGFAERILQLPNESEHALIIGILDINDFKQVNDRLGHMEGDVILEDVAQVLQTNIGEQGICARFGGDEFVFVFPAENMGVEGATQCASSWFERSRYSVSIGCAVWERTEVNWETSLLQADKGLYAVKHGGLVV